jgi:signal transduction histidine kinase
MARIRTHGEVRHDGEERPAIASSDSREALAALADEQAALRRVATLVARDAPSADVFAAVATEVASLFDTEITVVGRYENGFAVAIGNWSASGGGVPAGTRSAVGGHNVLTLVAETGKPARIDGYDDASGEAADIARRYGWRSSIAAPIIVEDHLWGVMLVATERPEGFPPAAEDRLAAFTDLVATAIANTQSRGEVQQLADEQAALRRVATVVAKEGLPEAVFAKVAEETGRVLGGVECTLLRRNRDGSATNVGSWGEKIAAVFPHGSRFYPDGDGVASTVLRTGQPYRIDDYSAVADPVARGARERGTECAVGCPILVNGELWGAIVVGTTEAEPFPPDTEMRLSQFADLVATAIANAETRAQLAASRRRIVTASDEARRRIERDLHDGTQQRLASLALSVRTAEANLPPERQDLRDELSRIALGLAGAIEDLQEISRGIHPAILSKGGLGPAIRALASHSPIAVDLDVRTEARLAEPVEVAAYFVVSEALANTAKHSHATRIGVALHERDGTLRLSIRDDGAGGADPGRGTGLVGLADRVEALGGSLTVHSRPGEGTEIRAELPIELATPS